MIAENKKMRDTAVLIIYMKAGIFSRSDTACIGDELLTKAMSLVAKVRAAELL